MCYHVNHFSVTTSGFSLIFRFYKFFLLFIRSWWRGLLLMYPFGGVVEHFELYVFLSYNLVGVSWFPCYLSSFSSQIWTKVTCMFLVYSRSMSYCSENILGFMEYSHFPIHSFILFES